MQAFGAEGEEEQASQAAANAEAFLTARSEGNWKRACEQASSELHQQLSELVARARAKPGATKPKGCAATLALLSGGAKGAEASQALSALQIEQVLSFRVREDGYAYLIYEAKDGAVRFLAMAKDGGKWKVNVPEPNELPKTAAVESRQ